jgi:hypothetical protein
MPEADHSILVPGELKEKREQHDNDKVRLIFTLHFLYRNFTKVDSQRQAPYAPAAAQSYAGPVLRQN